MTYRDLKLNPPKLSVKENAREVAIHLVSVMCDNKKIMKLKKNTDGDFKLSTGIDAYSNFQIKHEKYEIEWAADNNEWSEVFSFINSGTVAIEKVMSR